MNPAQALRHFLLALQFFTRIPVTGALARWVGFSAAMQQASLGHFPGVGLLVGSAGAAVLLLVAALLGANTPALLAAAALSQAATAWLTGALHEDGLADVVDGLAGGHSPEQALAIMKDPHIGAGGAVALLLALQTKLALLVWLAAQGLVLGALILVAGHGLSRLGPVLLVQVLPYLSTDRAKSQGVAGQRSWRTLMVALLWAMPAAYLASLASLAGLLAGLLMATLAWLLLWRLWARRLGGYNGDCLGATQQITEIAFYLGTALALGQGMMQAAALPW